MLTMGNLFCGILAALLIFNSYYTIGAFFFFMGVVFDYFDGFAARKLGVSGDLGKELDSLADVVTSGLVPGIVLYRLFVDAMPNYGDFLWHSGVDKLEVDMKALFACFGFLVTLFSALRLAKFNIDTRQTTSFIGLPTPANALFIVSLPLIAIYQPSDWFANAIGSVSVLAMLTLLSSYMLVSEVPLFALKFKSFGWKGNEVRYTFLILSVLLLVVFRLLGIPLIIVLYVGSSALLHMQKKNVEL